MMRLNQVTLPCTDFTASVAWWRRFGLTLIVDSPPEYARFECPVVAGEAPSTLSLHMHAPVAAGAFPAVYFEVADVAAEVARLTAAGLVFETGAEAKDWLWTEAWLRDPAGNAVCLYHAGEARRFPPWRIAP